MEHHFNRACSLERDITRRYLRQANESEDSHGESPFVTWLATEIAKAPWTTTGIPLIGYNDLDLKDAQAVPLISALADIIEATCIRPAAVPTTHATAA